MASRFVPIVAALTAFLGGTLSSAGDFKTQGSPQVSTAADIVADPAVRDALAKLDIWLEGQRHSNDLPGFSVGIVHDQDLIWSKGYGYADLAQQIPSTDETLYRIASVSKTFAATAVVQLAERGKLSLEDPVSRHLPWFVPKGAEAAQPVRVWHLLSHSSGLQREAPGSDWDALEVPELAAIKSATPETALALPPQQRLAYSNYGYVVAGELVTGVSGIPYARYVRENLLQPLGMTNTDFLPGDETRPGLAVPYGRRTAGAPRAVETQATGTEAFDSVGAMVSSVRDLAKWAALQFRDSDADAGPVLSGPSLRDMHRPHLLLADWSQGWGLGWRLTRNDAGARIDHGGSLPGYKSSLLLDPSSKVAVILLFNSEDGPRNLATGIMNLVSGPVGNAAGKDTAPRAVPASLSRFEGSYRDRWGHSLHLLVAGGRLQILDPEASDIEASATPLRQTGPTSFVTEAPATALTFGIASIVEFQLDATGSAESFTIENGGYRYYRTD